ncbi:hypothetical protein [Neorhizobium sp. NCHU2750]|uniref:hypothetical protein n=1 Tax=Neorhizobium sp. NCHU2750 TaxID=1825976 RepID=UPI000E71A44E|nr:hypothetical protein NCHU2750_23620 [Neorhizobium sp. NCHU2750]
MTMNFKNAVFCAENAKIDMEIEHPIYGWIPFTADPNDVEQHGRDLYAAALASALPYVAPVYTPEQRRSMMPALSARQFWMAAANIDIDKDVIIDAIKAEMPDSVDRKMMIAELESGSFERLNPTIIDVMQLMEIPAEQVDDLWVWATGI